MGRNGQPSSFAKATLSLIGKTGAETIDDLKTKLEKLASGESISEIEPEELDNIIASMADELAISRVLAYLNKQVGKELTGRNLNYVISLLGATEVKTGEEIRYVLPSQSAESVSLQSPEVERLANKIMGVA